MRTLGLKLLTLSLTPTESSFQCMQSTLADTYCVLFLWWAQIIQEKT